MKNNADPDVKRMDTKDPTLWQSLTSAPANAALLTFVISYLRILYDSKEPRPIRQVLEAALGASVVYGLGMMFLAFDMSTGYAFACAGAIGTLGVDQVRTWARRWAEGRV